MAQNDIMVVPVEVAAFAVNRKVRDTDDTYVMHRWQASFLTFARNAPPEPAPFGNLEQWRDDPDRLGAYVMWQLPEGLSRGSETEDGVGNFPLVPNRWLVTRRWDGGVRSWLVESDHIGDDGTVSALDPDAPTATPTLLGRKHDLTATSPWREPADRREPFLTALGPGLLSFSAYQPYNTNVFSIHDTLEDVTTDARVSYRVIGWYAQEDSDILQSKGEFGELMDELEWILPSGNGTPRRSLYAGSVLGIDWKPDGPVPESDNPRPEEVVVAIGNSTAEASAALEDQYGGAGALDGEAARLFKAFTLGALDELERGDGDLLVERTAHHSGFGPTPGGFAWRVVDRGTPADDGALSAAEIARERRAEADIIATLNTRQRELDAEERKLRDAQEHLFHLWSLNTRRFKPEFFAARISGKLDSDVEGSPAHRVATLTSRVAELRAELPWSLDQDELATRARAYAVRQGMRESRVLQRVPLEPFEESSDPVVLLRGANLHAPLSRDTLLPCRVADRLVKAVGPINEATVAGDVALVNTSGLVPLVPKLLAEFFILDRALAQGLDLGTSQGALPEYGTQPWRQPWQPMYLTWSANYVAIPFQEPDGTENWYFDRERYRWTGGGTVDHRIAVAGRQVLTPTSGHQLEGRLAAYANGRNDLDQQMIRSLRSRLRETDELSQRLDGLSAQIGQRLTGSGLRPGGALGALIADGDQGIPRPGNFPDEDEDEEWEDSDFQELRSGQVEFTRLAVVDRFGRAVNLIDNPRHFDFARPRTFVPDEQVGEIEQDRFAQLSPRLLQPGRLAFHFLDGRTGEEIDVTAGTNPVCAWLIHNRLDQSIACYAPEGAALGDVRVLVGEGGRDEVTWNPLPDSPVLDLDDLAAVSPHAHRFLAGVRGQGPAGFDALRQYLDDALAAIDPDGPDDTSLVCFFGRPIALVRAELGLELCGPARRDVHWRTIFDQPEPELLGYRWRVRLGEAAQIDDGLIGYVRGDDYDHIETALDTADDGYLRSIGNGERLKLTFDGPRAVVTMLLDTRAAVHATTDILPVGKVFVPQEFTDRALATMSVAFRAGPLLAAVEPDPSGPDAVLAPRPATATGTWSWAEPDGATWPRSPLTTPDPATWPQGTRPRVRTGFMMLDDAAGASREGSG
ncbi:hypothetical protein [Actinokineospora sp. NBRC 105648]|uniref:hypothetical protein n=1 Tax=Actinokineospora sp. NBRC 105648 TaxID=3032206 RepID=UPI0024A387F5|nr:hypothetical protein [Actinokineospora sp. NBRC 105648]GLZ37937.1 hypothetical protein Acsp05_15610 [Actinokineospora sp. NBRC 105648]